MRMRRINMTWIKTNVMMMITTVIKERKVRRKSVN